MSCDLARFRRVKELIRAQGCDILINFSTSGGAGRVGEEERFNSLAAGPDLASLDAGSMNFNERVFLNPPDFLEELARRMLAADVKPEIEVFDSGMIGNALTLVEKGLIKPPLWWQFVLGVKGGAAGHGAFPGTPGRQPAPGFAVVGMRCGVAPVVDEHAGHSHGRTRPDRSGR